METVTLKDVFMKAGKLLYCLRCGSKNPGPIMGVWCPGQRAHQSSLGPLSRFTRVFQLLSLMVSEARHLIYENVTNGNGSKTIWPVVKQRLT